MMRKILKWASHIGRAQLMFYAIVVSAVLLFASFFLIGFDRPYRPDPNFNDPRLTSVLMVYVIIVFVIAVGTALWAVVSTLRRKGMGEAIVNGVPALRVAIGVAVATILTMLVSLLAGSSQPLRVNGKVFDSVWSLRVADMFVASSLVMVFLAIGVVAYGTIHTYLKNR